MVSIGMKEDCSANCTWDRGLKIRLDQEAISVKSGRGVRPGCCLSMILFNSYSKYLTKEALEGSEDIKIGQTICTVTLCYWA